jgi:hypothetical protein
MYRRRWMQGGRKLRRRARTFRFTGRPPHTILIWSTVLPLLPHEDHPMRRLHLVVLAILSVVLTDVRPAAAGSSPSPDYQPDPLSVQRYGPAYRYPQAGWTVLHIEGTPYERGYQHGRLMAAEIAAALRCAARVQNPKSASDGWKNTRTLINALFVRRYAKEYLEEMKGIAAGATAAGARFDDRPIDLVDIVALNAWPEIDTLDAALEATPTGFEGKTFPKAQPRVTPPPKEMHCSAFAATGPATADGKIVFGHITMFSLYPSLFYNVWLDVKPSRGHRVLMQSYPGGIQSGMDYYMNDAGLLVCETTIQQTRFDIRGMTEASRIRQALQYADSIDKAVEILKDSNNGLYTNEWLLGDTKTNEIAMFELGTHKTKLWRSSKNEWFGGTQGFYWGCNNTKDLQVRLETVAGMDGRPANVVWHAADRDMTWLRLYHKHKGKIDAGFGREAFTTPPLAAYHSLDAKYTTTDMARQLKTWALYGPPLGRTWRPATEEIKQYPDIRPLVSNPWTVLHVQPPPREQRNGVTIVDLTDKVPSAEELAAKLAEDAEPPTVAAWHGTILPKADGDTWLATAFADYEKIVAQEIALREGDDKGRLDEDKRQRLGAALFDFRAAYETGARTGHDAALTAVRSDLDRDGWYRVASGKGVLVLHELRRLLGDEKFLKLMDAFGRGNAGREVTTAQFEAYMEKHSGTRLAGFFDAWLRHPGLPRLSLEHVALAHTPKGYRVSGHITRPEHSAQTRVDVVLETDRGEVHKQVVLAKPRTAFTMNAKHSPRRLVVDPYGWTARANGGPYSVQSFLPELEHTLIVYGTVDEAPTNREAAVALQRAIRERWSNYTVPVKSEQEVTDDMLKGRHVLLIGRPNTSALAARFAQALPVAFGTGSFRLGSKAYAHPDSAVAAAAANPLDVRYSLVVIAGLSADSTLRTPPRLVDKDERAGELIVCAHDDKPRPGVAPAADLVHEFQNGKTQAARKGP